MNRHERGRDRNRLGPVVAALLVLSGCEGVITVPTPPNPPPPLGTAAACPVLPATMIPAACSGARLNNLALTCGGNGKLAYNLTKLHGGATRVDLNLANGSLLTAAVTPIAAAPAPPGGPPLCVDAPTNNVGISIGVAYTGDLGIETSGPTAGTDCVFRSKADFTQFDTADPLISVVRQPVKDKIHETLDKAVIEAIFRPTSAASPARCARWRPM